MMTKLLVDQHQIIVPGTPVTSKRYSESKHEEIDMRMWSHVPGVSSASTVIGWIPDRTHPRLGGRGNIGVVLSVCTRGNVLYVMFPSITGWVAREAVQILASL